MTTNQQDRAQAETYIQVLAQGPRGVGTAVAFDWALTVQLWIMAICFIPGVGPGDAVAGLPLPARIAVALITFIGGVLPLIQGEAMRRGNRIARWIQIIFNALLVVDGVFEIPAAFAALSHGHFGPLVRLVVLLVVSPILVWLLTRPQTAIWYQYITSAEARARHGGLRWLGFILLMALIGGAAIAFEGLY